MIHRIIQSFIRKFQAARGSGVDGSFFLCVPPMAHTWDAPDWQADAAGVSAARDVGDADEFDYRNVDAETAGAELFNLLVDCKRNGLLSAKLACTIAFWASRAGAIGEAQALAYSPGAQRGKCSRHFDLVVGRPCDSNNYRVAVPVHRRYDAERVVEQLPVKPLHESFAAEYSKSKAELEHALADAKRRSTLPPAYFRHAVVATAPKKCSVFPIAMYLDGVSITRHDSILGVWMVCLLTNQRWLAAALRKTDMCKCGCRGWCSLHAIFSVVHWCIQNLASGRSPRQRHDGGELDPIRASEGGKSYGFRAALLYIKGDWAEYASTLGYPSWASQWYPCPMCDCSLDSAYTLQGVSAVGLPWRTKTYEDYTVAVFYSFLNVGSKGWGSGGVAPRT